MNLYFKEVLESIKARSSEVESFVTDSYQQLKKNTYDQEEKEQIENDLDTFNERWQELKRSSGEQVLR